MAEIFNNVHGFNLKLPLNTDDRKYPDPKGEWIEIIKKTNQLPTVKLTTIVLYYRNNGNDTSYNSNNSDGPSPSDPTDANFRFYNNYVDNLNNVNNVDAVGKQLGWIWGFPLFDVGREKEEGDVSGNWPRWGSCIGNKHEFKGNDTSGNETMLVDLSANKNIIVLDCSGLQPTSGKGSMDISNNLDLSGVFMILRVKSSEESDFKSYTLGSKGEGKIGNWNLWDGSTQQYTKWATLVKYEYECDIIGPTKMLDFTFDYFMVEDDANIGRPIYQKDGNKKNYLAIPNSNETGYPNIHSFNYSRENSCKIITGLQMGTNHAAVSKRMDITNILTNLSVTNIEKLQIKENWNADSSTIVKLIGGWYNDISSGDVSAYCYYGDTFSGTNGFITDMSSNKTAHKTEGWKKFIKLSTTAPNDWSDNSYTSSYELNNILWCSLQSPRKTPVTKYEGDAALQRYITNWIDLSGGDTSNEIIGGGYGQYPNTIDLPRKSINPYYGTTNTDTVPIDSFVIGNDNYLGASPTPLKLSDLNYFRVYYKLLIPPDDDESFKISFTTGKSINSVATFVRYTDMSGSCFPNGTNNLSANRDEETITLKWDRNSVNSVTNDISMQSICFTDIASGFSQIDASFNITEDSSLNEIIKDISKNYDISFNVFQLNFFERKLNNIISNNDEIPYTTKTLNTNDSSGIEQIVDISYVPINYRPYRYLNYNMSTNFGNRSIEGTWGASGSKRHTRYFKKTSPFNSFIVTDEKLSLNVSKLYIINGTENASIIKPKNDQKLSEKIIDISGAYDNSYVFFKSDEQNITDTTIIVTETNNTTTIKNIIGNKLNVEDFPQLNQTIYFPPSSLQLGNNFIPDYWRLPKKLNTMRKRERISGNIDEYKYLDKWENQIKISMVIEVLSLSLKSGTSQSSEENIEYILINSLNNSNQYKALTVEKNIVNSDLNLIFDVQGASGIDVESYLNKSPIIVELTTTTAGPFGPNSKNYIGEKSGYQHKLGEMPPDSAGINRPFPTQDDISFNDTNYVVDTILASKLQRGNGINGSDLATNRNSYNGEFPVTLQAWSNTLNNSVYRGTFFSPSSLKVFLIELPEIYQINSTFTDMVNSGNDTINIRWNSFYFSSNIGWDKSKSDVYWTINRINISTGLGKTILNDKQLGLNEENEYEFIDTDIKIFQKFNYTVTGKFRWTSIQNINNNQYLELDINGFTTPDCFVCKNNRFPYGRFNTTATNLKLYRPLLINTLGQEDQFGNKTVGGGCVDVSNTGLNLYNQSSRISSSNNIYANTTNQLSKKQTYVLLAKSGRSNFR